MWPLIFILLACAVYLNIWWVRRFRGAERELRELRREVTVLSEHRQAAAEEQLAREEALFNSMLDGVLLVDSKGRVQTINKSLEQMLGVERAIRGLSLLEAFRCHEIAHLAERVDKLGEVRGFELKLHQALPSKFFEVNGAIIRSGHRRFGALFIFHDITRLKELENMRKEFVANVSHELRTPLTLIKGFVETLLDGAKEDPETTTKFLHTIQKHTNRLTFLIEDLLTISKLESGQLSMRRTWIDLHAVVGKVLEQLQGTARKREVRLASEIPESQTVFADEERLEQVLFNLIENAIKYGAGTVRISVAQKNENLQLCISDEGPGIPPESLERVFERFYRVDRARSREQGGTGLGLAIVKHIVQSHGGEVWAESELGHGAKFFFTLPAPPRPSTEEIASAKSLPEPAPATN